MSNEPDYQATLAGWWENAEQGNAAPGDWIITHSDDDLTGYIVEQAPAYPLSRKHQPYRILARAPKPTPAWHNAVAVIAHTVDDGKRRLFENGGYGYWFDSHAEALIGGDEHLKDPVPLIPAVVDDAMVQRVRDYYLREHQVELTRDGDLEWMNELLTAALGIEDK